ncbi:MAG: hypothetical protein AAGI52_03620 [Bacteroidota bacterium]
MLIPLVLTLALSAAPPRPVPPVPAADGLPSSIWIAPEGGVLGSNVIGPGGEIRGLSGWQVRLGPDGRSHLVGPRPRTARAAGQWDDTVQVGSVRLAVRTVSRDALSVYVAGRFSRSGTHRSFLLRWNASTGAWAEASRIPSS